MTITDLKSYAKRIDAEVKPADRFNVTLTRAAVTYIGAFLHARKVSLEKSLADTKIKSAKAAKRALEYGYVTEALETIEKAKEL